MTRDEAVAAIQLQLSFRTTLEAEIILQLKLAQVGLEAAPTKPWFLVSEDSYVRTTDAEQRLELPTDFLAEIDEAVLRYVPDTVDSDHKEVDLDKDDYDTLRKNFMDTTTGTTETGPPEAYALLGEYFRIFPTPDDEYLIRMVYYKQDDVLTTNIENGWLKWAPYLMMGIAGQQIAGGPLRDKEAYGIFQGWENKGRLLLISQDTERKYANRSLQIGGPH